jgi:hypothetical protein
MRFNPFTRVPSCRALLSSNSPLSQDDQKGTSSAAAGEIKPEAYPLGYVEDFIEPRTKLAAFFIILG